MEDKILIAITLAAMGAAIVNKLSLMAWIKYTKDEGIRMPTEKELGNYTGWALKRFFHIFK